MNEKFQQVYDRHLNETYPHIQLEGLTFYPSQVLRECDPTAYRIYMKDYIDELREYLDEESLIEMGIN